MLPQLPAVATPVPIDRSPLLIIELGHLRAQLAGQLGATSIADERLTVHASHLAAAS